MGRSENGIYAIYQRENRIPSAEYCWKRYPPIYLFYNSFHIQISRLTASKKSPVKPFNLALGATVAHVRLEIPNVVKGNGSLTFTVFLQEKSHVAPSRAARSPLSNSTRFWNKRVVLINVTILFLNGFLSVSAM
ncbi:hypothetical protein PS15p_212173 [Mucor circinelloides]